MKQGSTCIINAASERDMAVFAAGMIMVNLFIICCYQFVKDSNVIQIVFFITQIPFLLSAFYSLQAELKGKQFLCRTAASFVSARLGITSRPPISAKDLGIHKERTGGLIVVGSYVPKTTRQVKTIFCNTLIQFHYAVFVEFSAGNTFFMIFFCR